MPISTLFPKLASPILLLFALAVGGCMTDQPNGKSVADSKTRDVVSVFEQGCLSPVEVPVAVQLIRPVL